MISFTNTQQVVGWSFILCHCAAWLSSQSASSFNVNSERQNVWWMEGGEYPNNPSRSYSNDDRSSLGGLVTPGSSNNNPQSSNLKSSLLTLVRFSNKSITCNDGSTAGYYVRKAEFRSNPDWIIFLEGGWYCFDERSCQNRWTRLKSLMSSTGWAPTRTVHGILSSDPSENPYWWNANHVLVPYCSSDTWSGTATSGNNSQFSFMGALILDQVIRNLIAFEGLTAESTLILAGSSAGGTGVIINLDRVQHILREEFGVSSENPRVRGIADSGWFIDKLPSFSDQVDCNDVILCPPQVSLRKGMNLWNARLPESCRNSYPNEPWSCFFGYKIYPTLKAPLFVFQWLFDEAQMLVNNVPTPAVRKEEWDYVYKVGDELKKTLINVTSVMIPSCIAHTILTHRDWKRVEVNSVYLPRALKCWESGGIIEESNFIPSRSSSQIYWEIDEESSLSSTNSEGRGNSSKHNRRRFPPSSTASSLTEVSEAINSNDSSRRNRRRHNRHRKNKRHRHRGVKKLHRQKQQELLLLKQQNKTNNVSSTISSSNFNNNFRNSTVQQKRANINSPRKHLRRNSKNNHKNQSENSSPRNLKRHNNSNNYNQNGNKKRNRRWFTLCDSGRKTASTGNSASGTVRNKSPGEDMRLIEKCSWPQCNKSCPKLLNPVTGEEVDFKDLLKSFGLDMGTMADALGIDVPTLNNMDHQVLLKMLTQNS